MKKLLTIAIALCLAAACLLTMPLETRAAERTVEGSGICGMDVDWTLYSDGELVISGSGDMFDYYSVQGYNYAPWYSQKSIIKTVTIEDGVTNISRFAFDDCNKLETVNFGKDITSIRSSAFSGCSKLASIVIPDSVNGIQSYAFGHCSELVSVELGSGVTYLNDEVFYICSKLKSLYICEGIERIDSNLLFGCLRFTDVFYEGTRAQKENINIKEENSTLNNAQWHYEVEKKEFGGQGSYYCPECDNYFLPNCEPAKATVRFQDWDGTALSVQKLPYKGEVTIPEAPVRRGYTFVGWDKEVVNCVGDETYTAVYEQAQSYTVRFQDWDGTLIEDQTYYYGETIVPPADPVRPADNFYTYTFTRWELKDDDEGPSTPVIPFQENLGTCTGNATYIAAYTSAQREYTVEFHDWDGTVLSSKNYHWGDTVEVPAAPTKAADNTYTYTFAGWDKEVTNCAGNATYTAVYTPVYREYTVKFQYEDGRVIESKTYHWGDTVTAPADPAAPEGYVFKGWTPEITACQGNAVYTAVFEPIPAAAPEMQWVQATLSLEGNIGINFYVTLNETLANDEGTVMRFTINGETIDVPLAAAVLRDGKYIFTCPVSAKNMADDVTAQIFCSEGAVGDSRTLSVRYYAMYMINNSRNPAIVKLMKAMLNYGAAAQMSFNHNTGDLANKDLSAADKVLAEVDASAYVHSVSGSEAGIRASGVTLVLETETAVRVLFTLDGSKTIDQYTFKVDGEVVQPQVWSGNVYFIEIPNIAAQDLDDIYNVTVGGLTVRYGGLSYVNQINNLPAATQLQKDMAKALFAYWNGAENYFNSL